MTSEQIEQAEQKIHTRLEIRGDNRKIVNGILQKIASHNIQNPYFERIKKVLDEMLEDLDKLAAQ